MQNFLSSPINSFTTSKEKWLFIGFIAVFVTLFLLIFQPFGVNNFDPAHKIGKVFLWSMIGFGLVIASTLAIFEFLLIPFLFKKNTMLVFVLRIISELILVATTIFLYYNFLGNFHDWHFSSYLDFIFNITVMSIIPIALVILYSSFKRTKQAYQYLKLQPKQELSQTFLIFESSSGKDSISLTLNDLLFIEAQDNYVSITFLEREKLKKQLLRATMKEIEDKIVSDFVLRCHRSFIVNMNKVEKVIKEGHQLKLFIPELSHPIIVSRTFVSNILSFLDVHHK